MRKLFSYLMMVILACCIVGCGENSSSELDQEELVYGYERLTCMDEIKGEVKNCVAKGDFLYFCTGEYAEYESMGEEMTQAHFYKCRLDGSELTELPVKWDLDNFEWMHSMEVSGKGELWLLFSAYSQERMTNTYILRLVQENGTVIKEVDINDLMDVEEFYVSDIKADAADNLYINTGYSVVILDDKGEMSGIVEEDILIENLIRAKDGNILAGFGYDEGYTLKQIDPVNATFCATYKTRLPFYEITLGIDGVVCDFYYRKGESLYGYDLATGESTEVLSFIASCINTEAIGDIQVLSEDTVLAIYGIDSEEDPYGIYFFEKKDPKDVKVRKIVTYASRYPDAEAKEMALLFNRSQDKYLVVLKDYQYSENPELDLYKDMKSGEVIDIVDLSGIASDKYIAQGLFEDLYSFMKRDKDVKKEDFAQNMLRIMETDGALYHITPTVGINGIMAKASDVNTGIPLTYERLREMESGGAKSFYRETKLSLLSLILELNYDSYIDWMGGNCYFNSVEFMEALEYADTYSGDSEDIWAENTESATSQIRNDKILFTTIYSISPADLQLYKEIYGEEIAVAGFPSDRYQGAAMSLNRDFAICASSTDKKGAWEFLKTFLSREYASKYPEDMISVSVRKDGQEDAMKRFTTDESYTDEFGNEILPMSYEWGHEDVEIDVEPLNDEQEAIYREVVCNMDHKYVYDYDLIQIVLEEAEPYFEGEISAREAADNIQNRVSVYMEDYR